MWMMSVPMATWTVTGMPEPRGGRERCSGARTAAVVRARNLPTDWPMPRPRLDAVVDRAVQQPPGFVRHAEAARTERFVHVLRGRARERQLEVVNDRGAVGSERRHEAALHQIDDDRAEAGLDDVRAEAPEHAVAPASRRDDGLDDRLEIGGRQHVRQRSQQLLDACARGDWAARNPRPAPCSAATSADTCGRRTDRILRRERASAWSTVDDSQQSTVNSPQLTEETRGRNCELSSVNCQQSTVDC